MDELAKRISELEKLVSAKTAKKGWFSKSAVKTPADMVAYFKGMPEPERRAMAPHFLKWRKEAARYESALDEQQVWLGIYATATLAEISKYSWWGIGADAITILIDRKVSWLQDWVEQALEQMSSGYGIGNIIGDIVDLVDKGLIEPPEHESYAIGIAYLSISRWIDNSRKETRPTDLIRSMLDKVEDAIWRQFEVEGGGEVSLANFDKYFAPKVGGKWADTLEALSKEGLLDRQRLLDASLDALNRGFKQYRASWFSRFHEQLKPSLEERAARAARYLDLVASPISPTVSMALAALKKVQKAGLLDADLVVQNIEPALYAQTAKTVKDALNLLADATKATPDLSPVVASLAAASLEHPKTDVQEAGLALLESLSDDFDEAARSAIAMRMDVMSPVLRKRAAALAGETDTAEASSNRKTVDIDQLRRDAEGLSVNLAHLAGVGLAIEAFETGAADVPAAPFNGMDVPRLDPVRQIEPISTFEELIDQALVAIEHPDDLDRVERVLDGAVRFTATLPPNAKELMAPLKRAMARFDPTSDPWQADRLSPRRSLQDVMVALTGTAPAVPKVKEHDPCAVIALRTAAMVNAVLACRAVVPFSTPTHDGFWIDPLVLVDRVRQVGAGTEALGLADECLALLRLAPDHRAEALQAAHNLEGEFSKALRYALGGDEKIGNTASLWLAAARSRAPFDDNADIACLTGKPRRGEQLAPAFQFAITWEQSRHGDEYAHMKLAAADDKPRFIDFGKEMIAFLSDYDWPDRPADPVNSLTTVALSDPDYLRALEIQDAGDLKQLGTWAPALWPQHPEPVFALSAKASCMLDGVIGWEPATEPLASGLTLALDPDVPVGPMAVLMLARGLNAIDKPTAQATVDALIAVIEDGRLGGATLGATMHELAMGGIVVAKRWTTRLQDVARTSPLAAQTIRRAIERAVYPGKPQKPLRNMHAWLEVLMELCVACNEAIEDPGAREGLKQHFTSGKASKLARELLKLEPGKSSEHRQAAAAFALEHRIARAERWAAWAG